jgi:hypothetical protein
MKKKLFVAFLLVLYFPFLSGQQAELIKVKAGTKILDYFPPSKRYMYSDFTTGRIWLRNGTYSDRKLNYNFLAGEVEFIQVRDTLAIASKKDIRMVLIAQDTFYYDKGYIEQLKGGRVTVGLKQLYKLKTIENKDSYGTAGSGSATTSYNSLPAEGNFYKLTANKDMIFERSLSYYISTGDQDFMPLNRNNVLKLYPAEKDRLKKYLQAEKIQFGKREDVLRLADFLRTLQ